MTGDTGSHYSNPLPSRHQYSPYILFPFGSLRFSPDLFLLKGLREHATISFILNISRQAQYPEIIGLWPGLMLRVKHELFLLCVRN